MKKICHITSVHQRYDTRILYKECSSLAKNDFKVYLVVADGKGNESINDVEIHDVGSSKGRFSRFFSTTKKVYEKALEIDADIYHFHDPELIRYGVKLLKKGKKVIYDVHEDFPRQVLSKPYLNKYLAKIISRLYEKYENNSSKKFTAIFTSTDFIKNRFVKLNQNTETIFNYPFLEEFTDVKSYQKERNKIVYIGSLTKERGIVQVIDSLKFLDNVKLNLAGKFGDNSLEEEIANKPEWSKVNYLGFIGREEVKKTLENSGIGLVTLLPTINYLDSLPVKMFEYMASGIPVIASDFPFWESIIENHQCGVCVDPSNPKKIAEKVKYLIDHPDIAEEMGKKGRQAIEKDLNWTIEERKLVKVYQQL